MKKLRMDLDELAVESFATAEDGRNNGTVRAFDSTVEMTNCMDCTNEAWCADGGITQANTCNCTIYGTCHGGTCDNARTCWVDCTHRSPCTGTGCYTDDTYCDQNSCVTGCFC